jgi:predicted MFS family arabinose efflux permease
MKNMDAVRDKPNELWSKDYISLMIANFFLFFAGCLLLPVLPVALKQSGVNDFQIGVVAAVFYVTSMLMRTFTSRVSARIGKKTLLLLAMVVFTFSMVGYYLFAGLTMIIILRLVQGLGFGASTTLYGSTVASTIPNERMGEGMGYFGLGISLAYVLGPCLGAAAVSQTHFQWVFLAAALLALISILLTRFIKADHSEQPAGNQTKNSCWLSDIIEPKVIYESVFILLLGLLMSSCDTYIVLYAKQMNIGNIFVYFIVTTIAEMSTRTFSGKLYDKKGMNVLVIPGAIVGLISCNVVAHAANLPMICIFAVFYGAAMGMIFPVLEANAMKKVPPERRIAANATFYNFLDIGSGLGPLLFGAVAQSRGYSNTFFLSGLIFVVMLVIIFLKEMIGRRKRYSSNLR